MPLASVAALLLLLFAGVRLISSTMEGASHRQQALAMALLPSPWPSLSQGPPHFPPHGPPHGALSLIPHPCRYLYPYLYPYLHPLTLALP